MTGAVDNPLVASHGNAADLHLHGMLGFQCVGALM